MKGKRQAQPERRRPLVEVNMAAQVKERATPKRRSCLGLFLLALAVAAAPAVWAGLH